MRTSLSLFDCGTVLERDDDRCGAGSRQDRGRDSSAPSPGGIMPLKMGYIRTTSHICSFLDLRDFLSKELSVGHG